MSGSGPARRVSRESVRTSRVNYLRAATLRPVSVYSACFGPCHRCRSCCCYCCCWGGPNKGQQRRWGRCSSKLTLLNGQTISTVFFLPSWGGDFPTAYVREQVADRWQRRESNQAGLGVYLLNIKECIVVDGDGESQHLRVKMRRPRRRFACHGHYGIQCHVTGQQALAAIIRSTRAAGCGPFPTLGFAVESHF